MTLRHHDKNRGTLTPYLPLPSTPPTFHSPRCLFSTSTGCGSGVRRQPQLQQKFEFGGGWVPQASHRIASSTLTPIFPTPATISPVSACTAGPRVQRFASVVSNSPHSCIYTVVTALGGGKMTGRCGEADAEPTRIAPAGVSTNPSG